MKKVFLTLIVASIATGPGLNAQERRRARRHVRRPRHRPRRRRPTASPAAAGQTMRRRSRPWWTLMRAFNAGDAQGVAATYTETALVVDEQGGRVEGRAAIRDQYAASFADSPGSTIAVQVDSLRFLGPETALEEGRTTI